MPNVWSSATPIAELLQCSRQSCDMADFNRDPSGRPCLRGVKRHTKLAPLPLNQLHAGHGPGSPIHKQRRWRKEGLAHVPMCILQHQEQENGDRWPATKPITVPKAEALALADEKIERCHDELEEKVGYCRARVEQRAVRTSRLAPRSSNAQPRRSPRHVQLAPSPKLRPASSPSRMRRTRAEWEAPPPSPAMRPAEA